MPDQQAYDKPVVYGRSLGDYLGSVALDFSEEKNVRVIPKLVSGLEYLENINRDSLQTNTYPDLYIISNESLEKASLSRPGQPHPGRGREQ